jgi:hypothetical protein
MRYSAAQIAFLVALLTALVVVVALAFEADNPDPVLSLLPGILDG